jgi:predicted ferric reductase
MLSTLWNTLTMTFYLIVLYRLYKFLGLGYKKYKLISKDRVGDVFIYTFKPLEKKITPLVGQFCYIKMKKYFGEEHPFTVMESYGNEGTLVFGIKVDGKYTKKLSALITGQQVLVDGPFGVYTLEGQNYKPKVIIAGGIGITPFVDLVKKYGNENTYMFNANRSIKEAVNRDALKEKLGERYVDVISKEKTKGKNIISGRLTKSQIKKILPENILKEANYFICGSRPFYENYKNVLLGLNVPREAIFYEEFGF